MAVAVAERAGSGGGTGPRLAGRAHGAGHLAQGPSKFQFTTASAFRDLALAQIFRGPWTIHGPARYVDAERPRTEDLLATFLQVSARCLTE